MGKKLNLNLATTSGFIILAIIVFMLITVITQQFVPTFKGLQAGLGVGFIFLIIAGMVAITIIKKEISFNKADIIPLLVLVGVIIALVVFFGPNLFEGTIFEQSSIQLQSMIRP